MSEIRRMKRDSLYSAACREIGSDLKDQVTAWLEKNSIEHG